MVISVVGFPAEQENEVLVKGNIDFYHFFSIAVSAFLIVRIFFHSFPLENAVFRKEKNPISSAVTGKRTVEFVFYTVD